MKKLNKTRELLLEEYKKSLTEGKLSWSQGWKSPELPKNGKSNRKYNGVNRLLLSLISAKEGYKDPRWVTFNQASKEGWKIKKGSHGVPIEYWYLYDKLTKKQLDQQTASEIIEDNPERAKDIFYANRVYTVFNGEQIDGIPEYVFPKVTQWEESKCSDFALSVVTALGVEYSEGGGTAYYRPSTDSIRVPERQMFDNEYEFASTLLHECSHASMNARRLNFDFGSEGFGSKGYAKEELVAEMSSSFLCADLGIEMSQNHIDNHKAYIQSWLDVLENEPEMLFKSIGQAEEVSKYIEEIAEIEKFIEIEQEEEKVLE